MPAPCRQRRARAALASLLMLCLGAPAARADGQWSGTLGATTNYILRGVSQTYGGGAVQLGGSYQSPLGWFAGAWGSNVDPYPSGVASKELDFYAGFSHSLGTDFTGRVTYTRYTYLDDPRPKRYDYSEISLTATYIDRLSVTVSYAPDATAYSRLGLASDKPMLAMEANGRWPVLPKIALSGGVGYYDVHRQFGVRYWAGSAGLAYVNRHLEIELARYFSDHAVARLYEDATADGVVALSGVIRF